MIQNSTKNKRNTKFKTQHNKNTMKFVEEKYYLIVSDGNALYYFCI